jgi:glycerate kinase
VTAARRLRVLVAPQEYKGSLTAQAAAAAIAAGVRRATPAAEVDELPLSDGGPGLTDVLVAALNGRYRTARVLDPLGREIEARFGLVEDDATAVVELAAASGITLLRASELDPLRASSYGTGQLIRAALDAGARRIIVGIGGSATNDGGSGMLTALGVRLLGRTGRELSPRGAALAGLSRIDASGIDARLRRTEIVAACDVTNPLVGDEGASAVYGPQKGATPAMVAELDAALRHFAGVIHRDLGIDVELTPGGGAAGGVGAALLAFLGAKLQPGFALVCNLTGLDARIARADLVLTGEGTTDRQSGYGKVVGALAERCARHAAPVFVLSGSLSDGYEALLDRGVTAAVSIVPGPIDLSTALAGAAEFLESRATAMLRAYLAGASRA